MDANLIRLNDTREKLIVFCGRLQWVFFACFALYCLTALFIAFYALFPPEGYNSLVPGTVADFIALICGIFAGGLTLVLLGLLFRKIGQGLSPFCSQTIYILNVLGAMFFAVVIAEALATPGAQFGAVDGSSMMALDYGATSPAAVRIDPESLLASVCCFALATIFRYGSTLQKTTNDLV